MEELHHDSLQTESQKIIKKTLSETSVYSNIHGSYSHEYLDS